MPLAAETRRDLLLLATVIVLATIISVLVWWLTPPARAGSKDEQPSTFFNAAYGTKAAYLTLAELGCDVRQLRRPLDHDTLARVDRLLILRPRFTLAPWEVSALREWIEAGNTLVVAPALPMRQAGPVVDGASFAFNEWFNLVTPARDAADTTQEELTQLEFRDATKLPPELTDVRTLAVKPALRFDLFDPVKLPFGGKPEIICADEAGIVALRVRQGAGQIIALADVYALTNAGLAAGDHPAWLVNLAIGPTQPHEPVVIAFDEYHHGFAEAGDSWTAIARLIWNDRWGWSVAQALVVVALALLVRGWRFGNREPLPPVRRRTQGEFATAAGALLQAADRGPYVAERLWSDYRARLERLLSLPRGADPEQLQWELNQAGAAGVANAVARMTRLLENRKISDAELLAATCDLHDKVEELEDGRSTDRDDRPSPAR